MDGEEHNKQHGEFKKAIEVLEDNVATLKGKWDVMQVLIIAVLVGVIADLFIHLFK
ncbi:hypothetical protein KAR91_83615 [Candidatus Pacearchaeota archaeon]|nr:hypothetical protein [Candidatus Pacearchaeota archaeon]